MSAPARAKPAITPGNALARAFFRVLFGAIRRMSLERRTGLVRGFAAVANALGIRRRVALENLRRAFPEMPEARAREILRGAYENLAQTALDAVTSDLIPDAQVRDTVAVTDWKGLDVILKNRQPALVASAHFGSWELFAEIMSRQDIDMSTVVRPLSGAFNELVVGNRLKAGVELILQRGALKGMIDALRRGRAVVQLIDQAVASKNAVFVPFFGRLASTTPAIAYAALKTNAPVYVVMAKRIGPQSLSMTVEGPIPISHELPRDEAIREHMATLTALIERHIRESPEQWLWLHRRWKRTPAAALERAQN